MVLDLKTFNNYYKFVIIAFILSLCQDYFSSEKRY